MRCRLHQTIRQVGTAKIQTRPPQVFIQQQTVVRQSRYNFPAHLNLGGNHFVIAVAVPPRIDLFHAGIGHVVDDVLGAQLSRSPHIVPLFFQPLVTAASENPQDRFLVTERRQERLVVTLPKIDPVGEKVQVDPLEPG